MIKILRNFKMSKQITVCQIDRRFPGILDLDQAWAQSNSNWGLLCLNLGGLKTGPYWAKKVLAFLYEHAF